MAKRTFPMTQGGYDDLQLELKHLETEKRTEAKERIKRARSFCDFREDSEYDMALKELANIEARISTIEFMLQQAEIIADRDYHTVEIGSTIAVKVLPKGDMETYTIVGAEEADAFQGKISYHSPIATSLLGASVGDEVTVDTPAGKNIFIIKEIM